MKSLRLSPIRCPGQSSTALSPVPRPDRYPCFWYRGDSGKPRAKRKVHPVAIIGYSMHEMEEHAGMQTH